MLEFLKGDVFRRIVATLVAVVLPIINKKTGLELNDTQLVAIICAIGVYVAQSGAKAGAIAKAEIAADANVQAVQLIANGNALAAKLAQPVADPSPTPSIRHPQVP